MAASAQHVPPASCDMITWDGTWDGTWEGLSATKGLSSALWDSPADASTEPQRSSVDWTVFSFEAVSDFSEFASFCSPNKMKKKMRKSFRIILAIQDLDRQGTETKKQII
jgi:hypothetical protein